MSNAVTLSKAGIMAAAKAMSQSVVNAGVPTHKYLTFHAQRSVYLVKETDKETTVDVGTRLALNWPEIMHGYICWKDGKVHDQVNFSLLETPVLPEMDTLPDHGPYSDDPQQRDGWREQITLPLKDLDAKVDYMYKTGADSSVRAVRRFIRDLQQELVLRAGSMGDDDELPLAPFVELGKTHFIPQGRTNKVYVPKFILVEGDWTSMGEIEFTKINTPKGKFMRETIDGDDSESNRDNARTIDAEIIEN